MNDEIAERAKVIEEKISSEKPIDKEDILFLLGLSLLKDHTNETE